MKIILLAILIAFSLQSSAQKENGKLKLGALTGYSFYTHRELKAINQNLINLLPFEARIIDNFGPEVSFGCYAQYEISHQFCLGPSYNFLFAGSRLGVRDYSGVYSFDQYLNAHQLGLKMDYLLLTKGSCNLGLVLSSGACLTRWKTDSRLVIYDAVNTTTQENSRYRGISWYMLPGLKTGYRINSAVTASFSALYAFDIEKKYTVAKNRDLELKSGPDWSGLRFHAGIEIYLKRQSNQQKNINMQYAL